MKKQICQTLMLLTLLTLSAWINVAEFRRYAAENRGYGLDSVTDVPFMEGEPGDVIQLGFPGGWNHAVLIGSVVSDGSLTI